MLPQPLVGAPTARYCQCLETPCPWTTDAAEAMLSYPHSWKHVLVFQAMLSLYFANKGPSSQSFGFSSSHVWKWELDYKESWVPKNWQFWTVVLEKTLESPLDTKEIQPVHPKGNQSWIFIVRPDVASETPMLWPPDVKNWLLKRPWCWE